MFSAREKIFWFVIISRVAVIILQFIFNLLCPDHRADAFTSPLDPNEEISLADKLINYLFVGLIRWDGQYFLHIAKYGYTYENTLAFYPLYPIIVRAIAVLIKKILFILSIHSAVILAAVLVNLVCFVKSALIFYDLSVTVLKNHVHAYKAAILYCISPASIFFSAAYSESMFAYLTFYTMLASVQNNRYTYLPLGLSAIVRSNGLINIGFPLYCEVKRFCHTVLNGYKGKNPALCLHALKTFVFMLNTVALSLFPFIMLQIYNYMTFCIPKTDTSAIPPHVVEYALKNHLTLPGNGSEVWCKSIVPLAYSYIQNKYWNVGFMKYYEFKQIPNFILAFPALSIMLVCVKEFFSQHKKMFCTLGLLAFDEDKKSANEKKYSADMLVFVVHGLFLTLFSIFFVHIQVSTRLIASASPLMYWFCALKLSYKSDIKSANTKDYEDYENLNSKWKVFFLTQKTYSLQDQFIFAYFIGYTVMGCFMFSNFLPWT